MTTTTITSPADKLAALDQQLADLRAADDAHAAEASQITDWLAAAGLETDPAAIATRRVRADLLAAERRRIAAEVVRINAEREPLASQVARAAGRLGAARVTLQRYGKVTSPYVQSQRSLSVREWYGELVGAVALLRAAGELPDEPYRITIEL